MRVNIHYKITILFSIVAACILSFIYIYLNNNLKKMLFVLFLAVFLLAILISFILSAWISKPIKRISATAKLISGGDFSKKIQLITNDEIGDLANIINHMAKETKIRIDEILSGKARFEQTLLSMFDGVMVLNKEGDILLVNKSFCDIFSISEDILGKKTIEIIRNIDIQDFVDDVLKLEKGMKSKEVKLLVSEEKVLLIHASPLIRSDSKIEGAVFVFHDISEIRKLENIRRNFVANISHELRTPVCNIKGYAETLLEGALDDKANAKKFLKIIHSSSEQLSKLIDDILELAKIESDKIELNLNSIDIKEIIENAVRALGKPAENKNIQIKINISNNISKIWGDIDCLTQVFLNLLDNAIKYNKDSGAIVIDVEEKDQKIQINIKDTGIGIPEKDLAHVFERFYRVDKARSRKLGGTGLGLSIVKHFVFAHNGDVFVSSIEGQGSTFSVILPKM